jgi:isopentenyldiphosphate isomerase
MSDEKIVRVNENDEEIGWCYRSEAHQNPNLIHREAGVLLVRSSDLGVLFQKRSMKKKVLPGVWSTGCAGHVDYGSTVIETAIRELEEELGVKVDEEELEFMGKEFERQKNKERNEAHFKYWFVLKVEDDCEFVLQKSEVDEVRFLVGEDIDRMLDEGEKFYEPFLKVVEKYWKDKK